MNRLPIILAMALVVFAMSCSGGGQANNPLLPGNQPDLTGAATPAVSEGAGTYLWGYYDVYFDIETKTITAELNRNAMFTLNVVYFLNTNPLGIGFTFNGTTPGTGYVDVDLDVKIKHPIAGQPKFDGYDVRGAFIGNGSGLLQYNNDLQYAVAGTDQMMMPDPVDGFGGPDGYTRWFNMPEFNTEGVFGYTPGKYASKPLVATATLSPYKYFADGLGANDNAFEFLEATSGAGKFSSGTTNTRNYYIRFQLPTPGVKYGYSIIADWKTGGGETHPYEAVAGEAQVTSEPYYVDPTHNGGTLGLSFTLFDWNDQPTAIYIESTVLMMDYQLNASEMIPVVVGPNTATYEVSIPADNVTSLDGQEFWIIAEFDGHDYTNPAGVPNLAGSDTLGSFFRYPLAISDQPGNQPPNIVSGVDGPATPGPTAVVDYTVTATDPDDDPLSYDWEVFDVDGASVILTSTTTEGVVTVDWGGLGAAIDDEFQVRCDVADELNPPVAATPLDIVITFTTNHDPTCDLAVVGESTVYSYPEFPSISFDSSGSSDPDVGDVLSYEWDFDGSGFVTGAAAETHEYTEVYMGPVQVKVSDGNGGEDICSVDVVALPNTLYYYDGAVNDGGIVAGTWGTGYDYWEYCPDITAWDEYNCENYPDNTFSLCRTPYIDFPDPGSFSNIHIEIWHWADMTTDDFSYGDLGIAWDNGGLDYQQPNWSYQRLVYIEGQDFNNGTYDVFSGNFGTEAEPAWSHFTANDYAGQHWAICNAFEEYGASSGGAYAGWDIRKLWVYVETADNYPPVISSGVDGPATAMPADVKDYTVTAIDYDGDPLTYAWTVKDDVSTVVFSGAGDGAGTFTVDWANDVGAADGEDYTIDCEVNDGIYAPVPATTLNVHISASGATVLYEYDGTVDDGGIVAYDDGSGGAILPSWEYCPSKFAWDETQCGPYGLDQFRLAKTPEIVFPTAGSFTTIHLEIWHWCDMLGDGNYVYATLGTSSTATPYDPNWLTPRLVYIEGQDFNETGYEDWLGVFGSEADPAYSHFDASDYAGETLSVVFGFGEYGSGNPSSQDGWNIRHLKIWYE